MAKYAHITHYIDQLEKGFPESEGKRIKREFLKACYEPFVLDRQYGETLRDHGIRDCFHLNVESLDLDVAVASLTMIHRAERGVYDPADKTPLLEAFENGYALRLLKRIAELDGTYERPNVVTFYHEYNKDGYLSNWYGSSFEYRGITFPTSEHWMMWQKARVFRSPDIAEKILQTADLGEVKHLGKQVQGYSDNVWDAINTQLMRVGIRQKFVQNEPLMNKLLSTGSAALGEAAGAKDSKWGVGFDKGDPKLDDPANWYGRNLLGITLMKVRSDLRELSMRGAYPFDWPVEGLVHTQVWNMNLLELARIPSTRPAALMYATVVAQSNPSHFHDARNVLRMVRYPLDEIHEMMCTNTGGGLPVTGWYELLDELALQVKLGKI